MFRLRHVVFLMTNAVIVGCLIIFVLSMGWYGFVPVFGAIVVGFILAWPASILVARRIKRHDPAWNEIMDRPRRVFSRNRRDIHGKTW